MKDENKDSKPPTRRSNSAKKNIAGTSQKTLPINDDDDNNSMHVCEAKDIDNKNNSNHYNESNRSSSNINTSARSNHRSKNEIIYNNPENNPKSNSQRYRRNDDEIINSNPDHKPKANSQRYPRHHDEIFDSSPEYKRKSNSPRSRRDGGIKSNSDHNRKSVNRDMRIENFANNESNHRRKLKNQISDSRIDEMIKDDDFYNNLRIQSQTNKSTNIKKSSTSHDRRERNPRPLSDEMGDSSDHNKSSRQQQIKRKSDDVEDRMNKGSGRNHPGKSNSQRHSMSDNKIIRQTDKKSMNNRRSQSDNYMNTSDQKPPLHKQQQVRKSSKSLEVKGNNNIRQSKGNIIEPYGNNYQERPEYSEKPTILGFESSDEEDDELGYGSDSSESLALSEYIVKKYKKEDNELDQRFIPPLVMRAYHLPGYSWWEDWVQFMTNNHPVLGVCCHHPRHPIQGWTRIATLLGSAFFGLAITNIIYLVFVFTNTDFNRTYFQLTTNSLGTGGVTINSLFSVTNGNIALWTVGVTLHALYDDTIWSLAACACFMDEEMKITEKMKRYKRTGSFIVMISVVFVVALTTFVVVLRGTLDQNGDGQIEHNEGSINNIDKIFDRGQTNGTSHVGNSTFVDDYNNTSSTLGSTTSIIQSQSKTGGHQYSFIISYLVELVLAYALYHPIIDTILFSGILTCGRFPILGGRPYEIKLEEKQTEKDRLKKERRLKRKERDERRKLRLKLQQQAAADEARRWIYDIEAGTVNAIIETDTSTDEDMNTIGVVEISIPTNHGAIQLT